uniref:Uncharacterized protein n=1 Tax=viral metagenome TaxID=1070528 RepID=A0A6H1ZE83_9ZZZZ
MTTNTPYEILVGVGAMYIATALTAMPAVNATPNGSWRAVGDTEDGVKVAKTRSLDYHRTDQKTGPVKATLSEEGLEIETKLVSATLENLADVLNLTVTDVPPGVGTIGTRKVGLHSMGVVEFALLFRGKSPYGDFPAQFYVPRGVFDDDVEQEYTKDGKAVIPLKMVALENSNAATEDERFGIYIAQDAAAT